MTDQFSTIFLQQLCDELEEPRVIIKAESPRFEVVAFNDLFVQVSRTQGQELSGKSMAELHSWNSENEEGAIQIYNALSHAIWTKEVTRLPAVRYDLKVGEVVTPSWWQAVYEPLINAEGIVEYVLCTTHNVTALVENKIRKQPGTNNEFSSSK